MKNQSPTPISRRQFLRLGSLTASGLVLAACSPTASPIAEAPAATAVPPTATPWPTYQITVSSASLREGPSTVYNIAGYLFEGETVRIIAQVDNVSTWYNVETEAGQLGWISETVGTSENPGTLADIPIAATIPVRPTATFTPTPTQTPIPSPTAVPDSGGGGGNGDDGGSKPRPTATPPL